MIMYIDLEFNKNILYVLIYQKSQQTAYNYYNRAYLHSSLFTNKVQRMNRYFQKLSLPILDFESK